jgi:phospholipid transport system substrate-binding protein
MKKNLFKNITLFCAVAGNWLLITPTTMAGTVTNTQAASSQSAKQLQNINDTEGKDFVKKLIEDGKKILNNESPKDKQNTEFAKMLEEKFAIKEIAKLVLGRAYKDFTEEQINDFIQIYKERTLTTYGSKEKTDKFRNMDFTVNEKTIKNPDQTLTVKTNFKSTSGVETLVEWVVIMIDGKLYVLDVKIEGISQIVTERSNYATMYVDNKNNPKAFLKKAKPVK